MALLRDLIGSGTGFRYVETKAVKRFDCNCNCINEVARSIISLVTATCQWEALSCWTCSNPQNARSPFLWISKRVQVIVATPC